MRFPSTTKTTDARERKKSFGAPESTISARRKPKAIPTLNMAKNDNLIHSLDISLDILCECVRARSSKACVKGSLREAANVAAPLASAYKFAKPLLKSWK